MTDTSAADAVVQQIIERLDGRMVACAESCTGGRLAARFADATDASQWFRGGLVSYQTQVKRALLGVRAASVLTEEAAGEMARGVARLLDAQVTAATSGMARGAPRDGVEAGTVFIATMVDGAVRTSTWRFASVGPQLCDEATLRALELILEHLRA